MNGPVNIAPCPDPSPRSGPPCAPETAPSRCWKRLFGRFSWVPSGDGRTCTSHVHTYRDPPKRAAGQPPGRAPAVVLVPSLSWCVCGMVVVVRVAQGLGGTAAPRRPSVPARCPAQTPLAAARPAPHTPRHCAHGRTDPHARPCVAMHRRSRGDIRPHQRGSGYPPFDSGVGGFAIGGWGFDRDPWLDPPPPTKKGLIEGPPKILRGRTPGPRRWPGPEIRQKMKLGGLEGVQKSHPLPCISWGGGGGGGLSILNGQKNGRRLRRQTS